MRILKRGPDPVPVISHVCVKQRKVNGDVVRPAGEPATDKPVYRNEVLEELSAAAREALSAQQTAISKAAQ